MLLPAVLNALGLTLRHSVIEHDPAAVEPSGDDAEYEDLAGQLRRLGFEPVGPRTTTVWFFLHHWHRKFESRVWAARQGDCIALTYKLRDWDPWRLCFVTAFSDGAIVETANQMANFRIDEPDHYRWALITPDRGLLLERHRAVCRDFAAAGARSVANLPAEQVNQCEQAVSSRSHRRRHRFQGLNTMAGSLVTLCAGLALVYRFADDAPFLYPATIFAWGLLWPAYFAFLFRASAGASRAEDARQANRPARRRAGGGAM
jgi:hypothetical protein